MTETNNTMTFNYTGRQSLAPLAMLGTLPNDPMYFEDVQKDMTSFLSKFETWVTRRNEQLAEEKRSFQNQSDELAARLKHLKEQYANLEAQTKQKQNLFKKQEEELKEWRTLLDQASKQKDETVTKQQDLKTRLDDLQDTLFQKRKVLEQRLAEQEATEKKHAPLLRKYEDSLGLRLVSDKVGESKLVFKYIDPRLEQREFYVTLNVSEQDYRASECQPKLPKIDEYVAELNSNRDFFLFVKKVRAGFVQLVNP